MTPLAILTIIGIIILALVLLQRLTDKGRIISMRPLPALAGIRGQLGRAIESGRPLHMTMGRGSLISQANPTSVASWQLLDHLTKDGCANGAPPMITVGEGTLLPVAQDSLRHAYRTAGRNGEFNPAEAQFIATNTDAFIYAGGAAAFLQQANVTGNIAIGRFGEELALIVEAANHRQVEQIIGSDDPTAVALATAFTENVLIGEEMLAVGAYLDQNPSRLASLQVQDTLRWIIVSAILLLAIIKVFLSI
ncbi:MAG: hypothetical protein GY796_11605 [Chloroflexi bacterium]|nr:hypothetical protein [Chloroflexota bacterium]